MLLQGQVKANEPLPQTLERILGKKLNERIKSELQAAEQVRRNPKDENFHKHNNHVDTMIIDFLTELVGNKPETV